MYIHANYRVLFNGRLHLRGRTPDARRQAKNLALVSKGLTFARGTQTSSYKMA